MPEVPSLTCPRCRGALEYQVTVEMLDTPVGKIDTGYCASCSRLFEYVRETRTYYDTTQWPPVCRQCRQPVAYTSLWLDEEQKEHLVYECREHPREQWTLIRGNDHWSRRST
jgi:hypothetical protein